MSRWLNPPPEVDEFEIERARVIKSINALDAAELACTDELALLLSLDAVTPNEVGRLLLAARNTWAQSVAQRVVGEVA